MVHEHNFGNVFEGHTPIINLVKKSRGAGLERFGLVHAHKDTEQIYVSCSWAEVTKKAALPTVGGGAHHHGRDACRLRGGRRGLEAAGLVHEHSFGNGNKVAR